MSDVRGSGHPAVVLEAGIAASSISWSLVQNRIAEFATVVSYDRAGFGWSGSAPHLHHRARRCRRAGTDARMRAKSNLRSSWWGIHSADLIVRVFEQRFPERVAGLVLVDPVSRIEWRRASPQRKRMLARGVALSKRGAFLARMGVVRLALKLLMSGSRAIPKLVARASAGRGRGRHRKVDGRGQQIAAGALARDGEALERSPMLRGDGRISGKTAGQREADSGRHVTAAICR